MNKKILFYFIICIIIRFLIVFVPYLNINNIYFRNIFCLLFLCIGISFLYQYITKIRKIGAFNQKIWWDYLRPIHGFVYIYSSYLLFNKDKKVFYLLVIDILIGISGFINYHFISKK